jgi:hypothetical protein
MRWIMVKPTMDVPSYLSVWERLEHLLSGKPRNNPL